MNTQEKRKLLSDYCNFRGDIDQCDGCMLNFKEYGCDFSSASDEEIEKMYERFKEGYWWVLL